MTNFDPANPDTWHLWMRVNDICTRPDHRGPYPGSKGKWWAEVAAGRIPPPRKFGPRISTWHRDVVAEVTGVGPLGTSAITNMEVRPRKTAADDVVNGVPAVHHRLRMLLDAERDQSMEHAPAHVPR